VGPHSGFDAHPSVETLEEYAFNRLSEGAAESVEEHLLLCSACQTQLLDVDEYIRLMKHATAGLDTDPNARTTGGGRARWGVFAGGVTALALIVIAVLVGVRRAGPGAEAQQVELAAFRGSEEMAHAGAGRPINVVIDASDLSSSSQFRVEVVNASGHTVWKGLAIAAGGRLSTKISTNLNRGIYWVRLSTSEGELLREYGLRAD
jgi:hypothetical protein